MTFIYTEGKLKSIRKGVIPGYCLGVGLSLRKDVRFPSLFKIDSIFNYQDKAINER